LGEAADGTAILDLACGGGIAFRGIRPGQQVNYVAADVSSLMLKRASKQADRRGIDQIEFVQADAEHLAFRDGSFDLVVTYNSLHCFPDPAAGLKEMVRVLRPGGRLRGTTLILGAGRRYDRRMRAIRAAGLFGPGGTADEYAAWLGGAGLTGVEVNCSGAIAYLSGCKA
jgi:ubiquinone/menaquinone biosynthesis C-methylase UbiE